MKRHARRARISGRSAPSVRARRAHPGTHPPPPIRPQPLHIPSTHPSAGTQSPRKSGTFSKPRSGTFSKPIDTERRSPTGIAAREGRETTNSQPAPTTHRWSAGLRPASRPERAAKPHTPNPRRRPTIGAPVSDRHRGPRGPRNHTPPTRADDPPPERRSPTGIAAREGRETTHRQPAPTTHHWSAGLRPASRPERAAKPHTANPRRRPTIGAPVSDRHRGPRGPRNHTPQTRADDPPLERRSPTGIAAREGRETTHRQPAPTTHTGAPVSDRHRGPRGPRNHKQPTRADDPPLERRSPTGIAAREGRETTHPKPAPTTHHWSAGLRPASRSERAAKPHTANPCRRPTTGAPVSDRHRGPRGPRNHTPPTRADDPPLERRSPTGIAAREGRETTHRQPAPTTHRWSAGQFSRWGPPTGIAAREGRETTHRQPAPTTHHRSAGLRPASRPERAAKPRMSPDD